MPPDTHRRILIVRDPDDTPATRQLLHRVDDLDRGLLVVRPVPGTTGRIDLAAAVLTALGKHLDAPPQQHRRRWWDYACAWAAGHRIEHLVVDRAHTLPADLIHQLLGLAHAAQATTWFIDAHAPETAPALAALDTTEPALVHRLSALADTARSRPADQPAPATGPTMPRAGFLTFRYACQQYLPPEQARAVDAAWHTTFAATRAWLLRTSPYESSIRPSAVTARTGLPGIGAQLSVRLAGLLTTATDQSTALLRLRATEAALFRHGLLLRHQPQRAGGHDHLLRCPLTALVAATIGRTVSTNAAAAAVLHLIYPLVSADGRHLSEPRPWRLANISDDGGHLITEHGSIPVPAEAHPVLRAHLHTVHAGGGADAGTALIDEQHHGQTALAQQVLAPLNLTPAPPPGYGVRGTYLPGYATAWMADRGLSLHALADLDPRTGTP